MSDRTAEKAEAKVFNGSFWQLETPSRRVQGTLTIDEQDRSTLEVVGLLFDEIAWTTTVSKFGGVTMGYSGDTDRQVADFQPRSICGDLSDGTSVSVVDAQGGRKFELYPIPLRQEFKTIRHVVMGEHVDGDKQTYASIKFRIEGPHHWGANDGDAFTTDGGRLALRSVGGHRGSNTPRSIHSASTSLEVE